MFRYYRPPFERDAAASGRETLLPGGMSDVKAFLGEVGAALDFPPYFGRNFDAMWDCLRAMEPKRDKAVLVHRDLPPVPEGELETYLAILRDAGLYWRSRCGEEPFEAWFPESEAERIASLLARTPPVLED